MKSFLVNRDIVCLFYLFVIVADYWGFWVVLFYVWVPILIPNYTENNKQQLGLFFYYFCVGRKI